MIGVDSGYEIYIGGNGGIKTEVAQFFCKVTTDEEVLEYPAPSCSSTARKGWYLERTCHYMERVGLEYIRARFSKTPKGARPCTNACSIR